MYSGGPFERHLIEKSTGKNVLYADSGDLTGFAHAPFPEGLKLPILDKNGASYYLILEEQYQYLSNWD